MSFEEMQNYHISVVERECNEGIVNVDSTKYTALAFLRKIEDINMSDNRGGRFNIEAQKKLFNKE